MTNEEIREVMIRLTPKLKLLNVEWGMIEGSDGSKLWIENGGDPENKVYGCGIEYSHINKIQTEDELVELVERYVKMIVSSIIFRKEGFITIEQKHDS